MEEIHYLIKDKLEIIQDDRFFKFGTDSVLLANFVELRTGDKVIDLGTGSGVIPLLLAYKNRDVEVTGVEIQPEAADLAERNVKFNNLEGKIKIINADLCSLKPQLEAGSFDIVVSNPPYLPVESGKMKVNDFVAIARHEIHADLEDVVGEAARLLKYGGHFFLVHRTERLTEVIEVLAKYNCQAKELRLVQARRDKEADIFLLKAKKGANPGLRVKPVLIIYQDDSREYTAELKEIYGQK
ncbi:tRNA1(Val) (adenine(37)-N6)-methyltransferase [Halanaerobium congolense]|jgi:HemK-like putative methylase|uniref:HemK-like putative methylase n=1 Tax=Halanaerobium congolense TaxID=54121 RepID=A0A1M7LG97_9FIRM|nr:tRNA1(Val) (adenine(37)-N6)-methyltransferase [Halanaerobium congolense]KXS48497.1 MAG: methyltransferase small [Halanaerobium sp. T82-1]PXV70105.1 HemK-like putative methylase [Halanaerobium congolense]TDP24127.1 HemK-like putative methylase [Halanaerobium congolense]TDS33925.1 HemK-like putative methylase [Halanaerobium congolense]SDH24873.1 HemK family putative methylases [Halanaerobium congolense]